MTEPRVPKEIAHLLRGLKNKRARIVVSHIIKHGHVTTEEIEGYGYKHPPRAARDVREHGIPLETFRTKSKDGRSIGAYRFGDLKNVRGGKLSGRKVWPKGLKKKLLADCESRCAICHERYEPRYLQIDHRVPYELAGETQREGDSTEPFMLLCGTCNRAKSWSCEHCPNWSEGREPAICQACYWASPEQYAHIALRQVRRLDVVWTEEEVRVFDKLAEIALKKKVALPDYVKNIIAHYVHA